MAPHALAQMNATPLRDYLVKAPLVVRHARETSFIFYYFYCDINKYPTID
jgi:hypothetical protein